MTSLHFLLLAVFIAGIIVGLIVDTIRFELQERKLDRRLMEYRRQNLRRRGESQ